MSKYARDLDEKLEEKVKQLSSEVGLRAAGVTVEAIRLKRSKNTIGEVVKGNDLVKLFSGVDNLIAIALYEDAFDLVDDATQNLWIETLLAQVAVDFEKGNVVITKPELNIPLGIYHKYKEVAVQKAELAILTIQQIHEKEKEEKERKKAEKAAAKAEKKNNKH